jgi:hypothetical protein
VSADALSGPPFTVSFTATVDDIVAFVRLLQRRLNMIGIGLGLAVMTIGGVVAIMAQDPFTGVWTFVVGLTFVLLSGTEFLDRWRVRRSAKSLIDSDFSYLIDQKGVSVVPPTETGRVSWSEISDVVENERVLILKRGRVPVVWVPKRAFASADEAAAIAEYIRDRIAYFQPGNA